MKEVKKFFAGFMFLMGITFVSAYSSGMFFGFREFFQSTLEYLPFAIIFLVTFYVFNWVMNRTNMKNGWVIALILSAFVIYGLNSMHIDFSQIFYKIGFTEDLLYKVAPWIVLALAAITLWKGSFGIVLIIFGAIILILGFTPLTEDWAPPIVVGGIMIIIGDWIRKKENKRKRIRELDPYTREKYNDLRKRKRKEFLDNIDKKLPNPKLKFFPSFGKNYKYKAGLRRGGKVSRNYVDSKGKSRKTSPGSFVSKKAAERYARRHGWFAAKKRFKK